MKISKFGSSVIGLMAIPLFVASVPASAATSVSPGKFKSLELRGAGKVTVRHGPVQSVRVVKGDLNTSSMKVAKTSWDNKGLLKHRDRLVIETCAKECPAGYALEVEITVPELMGAAVSGNGSITTEGEFPRASAFAAAVDGKGTIDVRTMPASRVTASADGGGIVVTRVEEALSASAVEGGQIKYLGNASVTPSADGGGSVEKIAF